MIYEFEINPLVLTANMNSRLSVIVVFTMFIYIIMLISLI